MSTNPAEEAEARLRPMVSVAAGGVHDQGAGQNAHREGGTRQGGGEATSECAVHVRLLASAADGFFRR